MAARAIDYIAGRRVRTVDVHAHCAVPAVLDLVNGKPFERPARQQLQGSLGHLVAEHGASQLMVGTEYAVPWVKGPADHVLNTPSLSDDERIAILGGNAAKLIKLPG
jgi:hypothetical protein